MTSMQDYLSMKAVSAGVLRTLLEECPQAAWYSSAFNPNPPPADDTDASDAGTIIHSILLEGSTDCVCVLDPQDFPAERTNAIPTGFTNKAIRAARDQARLEGKIPVLKPAFASIVAAVHSAQRYIESLRETEPAVWKAFQPDGGHSEQTITCEIDGVPVKIRPDRLGAHTTLMIDVKTSLTSVEPGRWGRTQLFGGGYYLSAAFYRMVAEASGYGSDVPYLFLAVSQSPPYLCSLVGLDPAGIDLAERQMRWALKEWATCMKNGHFPGYSNRVSYVSAPAYLEAAWLEKEIEEVGHGL